MLKDFQKRPAKFEQKWKKVTVNTADLAPGLNGAEDWIAFVKNGEARFYDRVCDHQGGKLISQSGVVRCPMHGWEFDAEKGNYSNLDSCFKKPLLVAVLDKVGGEVSFDVPAFSSRVVDNFSRPQKLRISYLCHACLLMETERFKFAIDPWLVGPAFSRGWWLEDVPPGGAMEELNSCDFIYISHNHPDHLHAETLSMVRKDMPLLTADYASGSSACYLESLGFKDVQTMGFDEHYVLPEAEFSIAAIPSGDFRDDSGLFFQVGTFSAMLGVDCNFLDFHRFPKNLTMLSSSFVGTSSGFPLCFENYSEEEKQFIITRSNASALFSTKQMLGAAGSPYFMPYAGMSSARAPRDEYIHLNLKKNSIEDYASICSDLGCELLNVRKYDRYEWLGNRLQGRGNWAERKYIKNGSAKTPAKKSEDGSLGGYINEIKKRYSVLERGTVVDYFTASGFKKDLLLVVIPTDDDFNGESEEAFTVDFSGDAPTVEFTMSKETPAQQHNRTGCKVLHVKMRREALCELIEKKLPWEDVIIGFQCRVKRFPDIYNLDFWYHFTNIFVRENARRMTAQCRACDNLAHSLV